MAQLRRLYGKLPLTVNETKSAVASAFGRFSSATPSGRRRDGAINRGVAAKPLATFKQPVRQLTRRSGGRSM